ncbi:DUF1800 domain-containing protein [Pelomonas sp. CA6]|uniref:DUF1800 domain-containing protein n=1 Tax=Pelomonas sp. CA6 TaxID=2907999 RepID=UPI001F4AAF26|nr:DUF1800 domain-containing protein [Pelomonas sp. CA6]MCH7342651.1 DUF1800 domain-containing protein [Pelomonas sp. CA6]
MPSNTRRALLAAAGLSGLGLATPLRALAASPGTDDEALRRALHALNRLGYGPRLADLQALRRQGGRDWLQDFLQRQLQPRPAEPPPALNERLQALPTLWESQAQLLARFREANEARRAAMAAAGAAAPDMARTDARREQVRPVLLQASQQRLLRALSSPEPLREVLVEFWFNHFNVFSGKSQVSVLVGAYERDAIRPHVLGRFRDLLGATARHPAMLIYLDNVQSVAPGWRPAARAASALPPALRPSGLNENYARELMELHTLGVDGGYTQQDVTELARMLTGWTVDYAAARRGREGSLFLFDARRHDAGPKRWLGQDVTPAGQAEGEAALDRLAEHPATARHIAFKLAQRFVADEPPPALVARLASRFLASGGDLRTVMQALVEDPAFWAPEVRGAKFKTPYQHLVSSLRLLDLDVADPQPWMGVLAQAGMPLYGAQTPDGYKNTAVAWRSPEALAQRVQLAARLAQLAMRRGTASAPALDAAALLQAAAPLLGEPTRRVLADEPPPQQIALLLASPDFLYC